MDLIYNFIEPFFITTKDNIKLELFTIDIKDQENTNKILEELINLIKTNSKDLVLLDKNPYKKFYSLVEKFVYELALYHLKRLSLIDKNSVSSLDKYYVEFWFKFESEIPHSKIIHDFHVDKDEELFTKNNILKCPILSTVTYLSDSNYPLVISNIKYDDLASRKDLLNKSKELVLLFPQKLRHICFDCKNFHGVVDLNPNNIKIKKNERIVLVFNIWKNYIPIERNYFEKSNTKINFYKKEENILSIKSFNNYKLYNPFVSNE